MRNLILTSTFSLITVITFAQSQVDPPQLGNSSKNDTVANASAATPQLETAAPNSQPATLGNAKAQNSTDGESKTPELSESTPPKKDY